MYSNNAPAPKDTADVQYMQFKDGSSVEYDRAKSKMTVNLVGEMQIDIKGNARVNVGGDAKLKADGNVEVDGAKVVMNGGSSGGVVCQQHICAFTGSPHPDASKEVEAT